MQQKLKVPLPGSQDLSVFCETPRFITVFIKTSLMQNVECYFITLPPLYMFRMPYTSILRSVI